MKGDAEPITAIAHGHVAGDRGSLYGHPLQDFTRVGRIWGAILGLNDLPAEQVGLMLVGLKVSREAYQHKTDTLIDIAGYAETIDMIHQRRADEAGT